MIYSVRNYGYMHTDSVYSTSKIYDYIFANTHSLPVIDINKRGDVVNEGLTVSRRIGIELIKEYS